LQLFDIELLCSHDATNVVGESLPSGILISDNTFDKIGQSRLVLVVFDHAQPSQRAELEATSLLVGVIHVISNIQNKTKHVHE
jgi:hypothetical protein